jgi:hypothetical protein
MAISSQESIQFSNVAATPAQFTLKGGNYALLTHATSYGTKLQLEALAFDGVTWLNVGSNVTADGYVAFANLPPGTYRFEFGTVTGAYISLTRIPA